MQLVEERLQKFESSEIQAEILRQDLRELESRACKSGGLPPQERNRIQTLILRKEELLAGIQDEAELATQGRRVLRDMIKFWKSGDITKLDEDDIHNWAGFLEGLEHHRRKQHLWQVKRLRRAFVWENRNKWGPNLRVAGGYFAGYYLQSKPRYYLARAGMRTLLWLSRRF